jgi:FAD:protein FMN transferase
MPKLLVLFLFLSLSGCDQLPVIDQFTGKTMGTTYTIKSQDGQVDRQQIEERLTQINQIFSSWDIHSELSQVNNSPANQSILLSKELSQVLSESIHVYQQTNGFFDPGLGRLIEIWGFGVTKVIEKPNRERVSQSLENSSIGLTTLDGQHFFKQTDVHLNLSAIAKGYAVDEVAKLLTHQGVQRFMVEIGGEIKTKGSWTIGIEAPNGQTPIRVDLENESIATSGNYRQYFIWEGRRYPHILNPHTGLPVNSDLFSVSVIHQSNALADAYATAMMVMGSKKAIKLAQRLKLKAVLILNRVDKQEALENVIKLGL